MIKSQLYGLLVKDQGHIDLIFICDTPPCANVYIQTKYEGTKMFYLQQSCQIKDKSFDIKVKITMTSFLYALVML